MTIKSIRIENFRCFTEFAINFAPKVSVIIGRNGAGKSSLLKAMLYALGFVFSKEETLGQELLVAGNYDVEMEPIKKNEFYMKQFNGIPASITNIHSEGEYMGAHLIWDIAQKNFEGEKPDVNKYIQAYKLFMDTFKKTDVLPVFAFFSDSFPHKVGGMSDFAKEQVANDGSVVRTFGYEQWDGDTTNLNIWLNRLINAIIRNTQLNNEDEYSRIEAAYVTQKLMDFSKPIHEDCDDSFVIKTAFFKITDNKELELWLRMKNDNDILFQNLPAGYLRLYSIVLDIGYRHWILNHNAEIEPEGIVMIDEVDLHLHPSLAVEAVERLERTFPKIQFVLTTHSPLVVSNIKTNTGDNKIFRMVKDESKPHEVPDVYGIDYNTALHSVMESSYNNEVIEFLRSSILRSMRRGKPDLVEAKKEELRQMVTAERFGKIMADIQKSYHDNL
jgi:predicted ATP-binding protein involved in virulence